MLTLGPLGFLTPWILTALTFLMLITYIPEITMFLPNLLGMK